MKKVFLLLAVLLVVLPLSARPKLELAPRASLYISSVNVGIGADIIANPTKKIGIRVNLAELIFGDYTVFSLNHPGNLELLYYTNIADIISYLNLIFGLQAGDVTTIVTLGGGAGYEASLGKGNKLFLEPSLLILTGDVDTDVTLRLSGGFKFGIF
ncbi:hypothetical protein JW879_01005 [candidate division WOR-3 bacterium]|nr:hypothetical protein [candidate division WOR-3 bacterium]